MILTTRQIEMLSQKIGQPVDTPSGASVLQIDIESSTGARLGLNTVKRLVGVLPSDDSTPRQSTLNIIANYLGFPDWGMLEAHGERGGSRFGDTNPFIEMSGLHKGAMVEICWRPDRRLLLRHDGAGEYVVVESEKGKLQPGDILKLSQLAIGFPFVASMVNRGGETLGSYQSADGSGIIRFLVIE